MKTSTKVIMAGSIVVAGVFLAACYIQTKKAYEEMRSKKKTDENIEIDLDFDEDADLI